MIGAMIAKQKMSSAYDALNNRDCEAFLAAWRDDCTFIYPGDLPVSGKIEGKPAIERLEFVTRDGTDYGEIEVPLETKISQVSGQLKSGKVVIVFDQTTETCNILRSSDPALKMLDD